MIEYKDYQLVNKLEETEDIYTLTFKPLVGQIPYFKAGQFFMIKIEELEAKPNFRPYSALFPYSENNLSFGIKKHGVFSSALLGLKENENVKIAGPYGQFLFDESMLLSVFIAGGIGITPFICMLKELESKQYKNKVYLFYSNKSKKEIAYKNLLDEIKKKNEFFEVVYTLTQENLKEFENGRINIEMIKKHLNEWEEAKYYICGGKEFAQQLSLMLENNGIKKEKIVLEKW
ncbi:MAG: ferredoxin--NADP reductase [Candidatus Anstonellaceae archaeon]